MLCRDWILHHLEGIIIINKTTCRLMYYTVTLGVVLRHATVGYYCIYVVKSVTDRVGEINPDLHHANVC